MGSLCAWSSAARHLVSGPCVQGVADRQLHRQLALVVDPKEAKPEGGIEPGGRKALPFDLYRLGPD